MERDPERVAVLLVLLLCRSSAMDVVNVVDLCGQTVHSEGMIVNSHHESKKYYFVTMGTDCHLTMRASSPKDKVQFYFRFFLVYSLLRVAPLSPDPFFPESPPLKPTPGGGAPGDPCSSGSYVQFYDGPDRSSPPLGSPLCGKSPPRPVLSTGNFLTLRLVTRGTQPRVDFVGDFTSFRLGFNQSECSGELYFTCRNRKCIPASLVCDDKGIDNCGDGSDLEENLTAGCKAGQLLAPDPQTTTETPPPSSMDDPTGSSLTGRSCEGPEDPRPKSVTDGAPLFPLLLYLLLGVLTGSAGVCWCCWSPGWFLWRVSVCRFLSGCNSPCASCHFCARRHQHRPAKVAPHAVATATAATATADGGGGEDDVTTVAL